MVVVTVVLMRSSTPDEDPRYSRQEIIDDTSPTLHASLKLPMKELRSTRRYLKNQCAPWDWLGFFTCVLAQYLIMYWIMWWLGVVPDVLRVFTLQ